MPQPTVFDKNSRLIKQVIAIVVIIIAIAIVVRIYKAAKAAGAAAGDAAGSIIIETQTGITPSRQLVCSTVADSVHQAIHGDDNFFHVSRPWEDEEAAILALNKLVTANEGALTSKFYARLWGNKNLKEDINQYLDSTDRGRINPVVLVALS